jgi:hypothetical protein
MRDTKRTTSPSEPRRGSALLACGLLWAVLAPLSAEDPPEFESVYPLRPADQVVAGARPVFGIGYSGLDESELRRMRFRLTLTRVGSRDETYDFDQRKRRSGWIPGEPGEMLFRPPWPLADGSYRWEAWAWDGVRWVDGGEARRIRVDTVPPAEVAGLRASYDAERKSMRLTWEPVTLDRDGAPEFVTRYRVYRYTRGPQLPRVRPFEIGTTETPSFVDEGPLPDVRLVVYKIAAEDEAGNVTGVRR